MRYSLYFAQSNNYFESQKAEQSGKTREQVVEGVQVSELKQRYFVRLCCIFSVTACRATLDGYNKILFNYILISSVHFAV